MYKKPRVINPVSAVFFNEPELKIDLIIFVLSRYLKRK